MSSLESNKQLKKGDLVTLEISTLAQGGSGVGRSNGLVIFVPYTCPGDLVEVEITALKKKFAEATLRKILRASTHRVQAPCVYFGECGGCTWQHVSYQEQLNQKSLMIKHLFKSDLFSKTLIEDIQPSPKNLYYRNRIQLQVINQRLGYHARKSHRFIPIEKCEIADERINELIKNKPLTGNLGKASRVEIGLYDAELAKIKILNQSPPDFFQVNDEINHRMLSYVKDLLMGHNFNQVYDLYCGAGNFLISLAQLLNEQPIENFIGLEINPFLVEQAKIKAKELQLNNVLIEAADVEKAVLSLETKNSAIVLDPPRAGCGPNLIKYLIKNPPDILIYISCHPATAKRDIEQLWPHFRATRIKPFDMFPQTDHIEIIALLEKLDQPR